ncbi:MAG: hypothetical protein KFW21_01685 [Spirochaetota bacterium]|nr:hypothetical protein [Spirochaetota bacterium]
MKKSLFILLTIVLAGCTVTNDKTQELGVDGFPVTSGSGMSLAAESRLMTQNTQNAQGVLDRFLDQMRGSDLVTTTLETPIAVLFFTRGGQYGSQTYEGRIELHNPTGTMEGFQYITSDPKDSRGRLSAPIVSFVADKVKLDFGSIDGDFYFGDERGEPLVFYIGDDLTGSNPKDFLGYRANLDGATVTPSTDGSGTLYVSGGYSSPLIIVADKKDNWNF